MPRIPKLDGLEGNFVKLGAVRLLCFTHLMSAVIIPFFREWGRLSFVEIFALQTWFMLASFLMEVPTGAVADRFGRKVSVASGAFLLAAASLLYGSFPNLVVFVVAEAVFATSIALISGADEALAYDSLLATGREAEASRVMARLEAAKLAGILAGALLGAVAASRLGVRWPMLLPLPGLFEGGGVPVPEGVVVAEKFIEGLDAPKGMAVHDGHLYVADISLFRIFDATTGEALDGAEIEGAQFLNDVTVWQDDVFVSDSGTGRIWRFTGTSIDLSREGEELAGVNGLLGDGEKMLVSTMNGGYLFEATTEGGWPEIASGMIDADGIGVIPGGGFLVSSWPGEIHHVAPDRAVSTILDTREVQILQNDLTMFGDVVIVPNWLPGTVTAWRLVQ